MKRITPHLLALSIFAFGCGADSEIEAVPVDAGTNVGTNSGTNSGSNSGTNVGTTDMGADDLDMGQEPVDMGQEPVDMGDEPVDMGDQMADMGADADLESDSGTDAGVEPSCDINGFTVTSSSVSSIGTDLLFYEAIEGQETDPMFKLLDFAFYTEYGATAEPQTVTFDGENYADCGVCLLAYECTPTTCGVSYLVESGTANVTAAGYGQGDAFTATFDDLVLREVTIDSDTLMSTPVPGGKTWCIESLTATGTTVAN